jgi:hypothetical protein
MPKRYLGKFTVSIFLLLSQGVAASELEKKALPKSHSCSGHFSSLHGPRETKNSNRVSSEQIELQTEIETAINRLKQKRRMAEI